MFYKFLRAFVLCAIIYAEIIFITNLTEDSEVHQSDTAKRHMEEFETIKETISNLHEKIEIEAGSITQVKMMQN